MTLKLISQEMILWKKKTPKYFGNKFPNFVIMYISSRQKNSRSDLGYLLKLKSCFIWVRIREGRNQGKGQCNQNKYLISLSNQWRNVDFSDKFWRLIQTGSAV